MKKFRYYILKGKKAVGTNSTLEWAKMLEDCGIRRVGLDVFSEDVRVSTVFLGLDHNFFGYGKPLLFETLVFGGKHDQLMQRYSTWEEAKKGHKKITKLVKSSL